MRILKKVFKIIGIAAASVLLLLLVTVAVAAIFQDELTDFTIEQLESTIDAPISVGKVSIAPFFSFPRISAEIHSLYVGDPKTINGDTLLFINSLKVGLDSWDLINGLYTIEEMKLTGLDFDYIVDSTGGTNLDFLINAFSDSTSTHETSEVSPLDIDARKISLENILVRYNDQQSKIAAQVRIPRLSVKAKTHNNIIKGKTEGSFVISDCNLENTKIDLMESCTISFEIEYNDNIALIDKLSIITAGLNIGIEGNCVISDTLSVDADIVSNDLDMGIIQRYFPEQIVGVEKPEDLPQVDFISIDVNMYNYNSVIDIKQLAIESEGLGLGLRGNFKLEDTLSVDATIDNLNLDLGILSKYIPKQYLAEYGITETNGVANISAEIAGYMADSTVSPGVRGTISLNNIMVHTADYPRIDVFNLTANYKSPSINDLSNASIEFKDVEIVSNNSSIKFTGDIMGMENTQYDLKTDFNIDLQDFTGFIPDSLASNIGGKVMAKVNTNGILPSKIGDDFIDYVLSNTSLTASFEGIKGLFLDSISVDNFTSNLTYKPRVSGANNLNIEGLEFLSAALNLNIDNASMSTSITGNISKPENLYLDLKSLKIQSGNSKIIANGRINNLLKPEYNIITNINIDLKEMEAHVPDTLVKQMSGTVVAYIRSEGRLNPDSIEHQLFPIVFEQSSFDIAFDNLNFEFPDPVMNIGNINARFGLRNDILNIENISGRYNSFQFKVDSTIVRNLYKTIIQNQKEELYVKTNIGFGKFVFDDFKDLLAIYLVDTLSDNSSGADAAGESTIEVKNWNFLIHGKIGVDAIIIDSTELEGYRINRLHIDDMSTLFMLTDSSYVFDQFRFNVFEGEMNNSLKYKLRKDGTTSLSTHNIIKGMNIRTMLKDMDNFGMDSVISYQNISGILSTDIHTFIPIDDSIIVDRILVSGDLTLEKGGVYDYAPATEISRFTNIKELDNIQFKTLRSSIFMFKNKMYVPRTNIVSNAIDIAAFGMQDLDGDCEYHLELHLSNILFGKSKKRNKKQDSSGDEVDKESLKKRSQKIKYIITDGKSKVGPDSKESRNDMMNKIRVQNKMLDFIFFPKNIHYNTSPDQQ